MPLRSPKQARFGLVVRASWLVSLRSWQYRTAEILRHFIPRDWANQTMIETIFCMVEAQHCWCFAFRDNVQLREFSAQLDPVSRENLHVSLRCNQKEWQTDLRCIFKFSYYLGDTTSWPYNSCCYDDESNAGCCVWSNNWLDSVDNSWPWVY